jgi:hypothetical protein
MEARKDLKMADSYEFLEKQYNRMKANEDKKTVLEFTSDPENSREIVLEVIKALRGQQPGSRERSLAITKLQEAQYWLGEAMFAENDAKLKALTEINPSLKSKSE